MTKYEYMEAEAHKNGLKIVEVPLEHTDGITKGKLIGIRTGQTSTEKACVLAEEIAHAKYTVGDILDQSTVESRKQELLARTKAYDKLIGCSGIVDAFEHGCRSVHEAAEFLDVTEEFFVEAIERYRNRYGMVATYGKYIIQFEPCLSVAKLI